MKLDLINVLTELQIADTFDVFQPHWDDSEASLPDVPPFLDAAEVAGNGEFVGLSAPIAAMLQEAAREVRKRPALLHLAWHCHQLLFHHLDYEGPNFGRWPELDESLGEHAGCFYMLVALGVVPLMLDASKARSIPVEIVRNTLSRFDPDLIQRYRDQHEGQGVGVPVRVLYWLRHYTAGDLYCLGRMEYMVRPFYNYAHVYRNVETDEVLALASDGLRFNAEGFIDAEAKEEEIAWTSRLVSEGDRAIGCPISPAGHGVNCEVELPLKSWRPALLPGDSVLDTHIPGGGGMTPEACADTHRRAMEFFSRYFPDRPFKGIACASWILDPHLEEYYSPTSNMVRWQKELYLFPWPSGRKSGLYFVFGKDDVDLATAPRDTSLRRAMLDHLAGGGKLISGGMFILTEDFQHFGTRHYLSHWPPVCLRS